jgi:phosphoglycolate phosphatase-like HAD superfamily hydrolase
MRFDCRLIIFDKDGTLIHFDAMWGGWVTALARRLEAATDLPLAARLFAAMGYDPATGRVLAHGALAATPMSQLRALTLNILRDAGLAPTTAEAVVEAVWHIPDPVILAKPFTDLRALFSAFRERGIQIAIATTDDRAPTEATLAGLGLTEFVAAMVCADDGIPAKPAPDMVLTLCQRLSVDPAYALVVGDSVADMQMGRAAGAGRVVGVLTGVSAADVLAPHADVVLPSIADLLSAGPAANSA